MTPSGSTPADWVGSSSLVCERPLGDSDPRPSQRAVPRVGGVGRSDPPNSRLGNDRSNRAEARQASGSSLGVGPVGEGDQQMAGTIRCAPKVSRVSNGCSNTRDQSDSKLGENSPRQRGRSGGTGGDVLSPHEPRRLTPAQSTPARRPIRRRFVHLPGPPLTEELISDRRAEAERE